MKDKSLVRMRRVNGVMGEGGVRGGEMKKRGKEKNKKEEREKTEREKGGKKLLP